MNKRGEIRNRKSFSQAIRFTGMQWGKITPTDIDCFLDFGNKVFVTIESKHEKKAVPFGQRWAIERLVDGLEDSGKVSMGVIARHSFKDTEDVILKDCRVAEIRFNKKWTTIDKDTTVMKAINKLLKKHAPKYLD